MGKLSALLAFAALGSAGALAQSSDTSHFQLPIEGVRPDQEYDRPAPRRGVSLDQKRSRLTPTGESRPIWWNGAQGTYRYQPYAGRYSMVGTKNGKSFRLFEATERAQNARQAEALCAKRGARLIDGTWAHETCTFAADVLGTGADDWFWRRGSSYAQGVQGYNGSGTCYFGTRHLFSTKADAYAGGLPMTDFSGAYVRAKLEALDSGVDTMTNRRDLKDRALLTEGGQIGPLVLCVQ